MSANPNLVSSLHWVQGELTGSLNRKDFMINHKAPLPGNEIVDFRRRQDMTLGPLTWSQRPMGKAKAQFQRVLSWMEDFSKVCVVAGQKRWAL